MKTHVNLNCSLWELISVNIKVDIPVPTLSYIFLFSTHFKIVTLVSTSNSESQVKSLIKLFSENRLSSLEAPLCCRYRSWCSHRRHRTYSRPLFQSMYSFKAQNWSVKEQGHLLFTSKSALCLPPRLILLYNLSPLRRWIPSFWNKHRDRKSQQNIWKARKSRGLTEASLSKPSLDVSMNRAFYVQFTTFWNLNDIPLSHQRLWNILSSLL